MLFNSTIFFIFFIIVYAVYLLARKNYKRQNHFLLAASYLFYGWWNWKFLGLLFLSTIVDYSIGRLLEITAEDKRRKMILLVSIVVNLSILGFFKYFNFFSASFVSLMNLAGLHSDTITLEIILPVGISFYTFQTMSYTIDVYRKKLEASRNFFDFALFVSFFPQLVAGPIERAANLLPQINKERKILKEQVYAAAFLIIWGYFKKIAIADNMAVIVDKVFGNLTAYHGFDLGLAVFAFTIQIYCDFSAYSDIARGIAKLLGFELMVNFKLPYFSINPSDFWNRWHISLSSWLKDYLYIPLGGNRRGKKNTYANLFLTMVIGGLWHGAAATFVIWGVYHGTLLIIYRLFASGKENLDPWQNGGKYPTVLMKILLMFFFTMVGWMIFRAGSVGQIAYFIKNFGFNASFETAGFVSAILLYSSPLVVMQIFQYIKKDLLFITKLPWPAVSTIYSFMILWIFIFGSRNPVEFIYFQF